eukprot:551602_1
MQKEENNPAIDYVSVNMTIFFYTGIGFLALYRFCLFIGAIIRWIFLGDGDWYDVILVIFDIYIFKAVYESFSNAQGVITKNAKKRMKNAEKKRKKREDMKMQMEIEMGQMTQESNQQPDKISNDIKLEEEEEIQPADLQMIIQLGEAVTESMPQIVLQSVFIIRSANDPDLVKAGSNMYLIFFSIIASLFSITGKYVWVDAETFEEEAKSLKPRQKFPGCVQYWYMVRTIWRMSHVTSRFGVFVLIWTVLGGAWLPIWAGFSWLIWFFTLQFFVGNEDLTQRLLLIPIIAIVSMIGTLGAREDWAMFVIKYVETAIGLVLITTFATLDFDCGICSDPEKRQLFGNSNERILIFWSLSLGSSICEIILQVIMFKSGIVNDESYWY